MPAEDPDMPVWAFETTSSTIHSLSTMTQLYDVVADESVHVPQTPNNSRDACDNTSHTQDCVAVHLPAD